MSRETLEIHWSECIVIFNSLISNIERLREIVESNDVDDDELYEVEEELNDYVTLLVRLRTKYKELSSQGELSEQLSKKLSAIV